jgi:hypothetical protein
MALKLDRIISIATLSMSVVAVVLVLRKPQPVAPPQPLVAAAANAQSFERKVQQIEQPQAVPGAETRLNAQEINAAIAQAMGSLAQGGNASFNSSASQPAGQSSPVATGNSVPANNGNSPLSGDLGSGEPDVKDYKVNFEGDQVVGQFLVPIAGKDVWVTLRGRLGSKDGYATFEPTEIKFGDLNVPVSLVNDQLQKKLLEQRDRLKLPDSVSGLRVENSEVVVTNK